jgi:hypothetical protein
MKTSAKGGKICFMLILSIRASRKIKYTTGFAPLLRKFGSAKVAKI